MDATGLLQELLRIETTNPPGSEEPAAQLLDATLRDAGLETKLVSSPGSRVSLVARIPGPTDRPALVLLSHTDVVPVETERWTRDPFGGEIDSGAVWGRGALDMKGVAAMHAAAAAALAASGATPAREVILCAVADEEAGGDEGARWLIDAHPELVGFGDRRPAPEVLGEGAYGLSDVMDRPLMPIVVGEKIALWLRLRARGDPAHGMMPPARMAPRGLAAVIAKVAGYGPPRVHPVMREQFGLLARSSSGPRAIPFKLLGSRAGRAAVTAFAGQLRARGAIGSLVSDTISATEIHAGYKHNVVPSEATGSLDCRLLPDTEPRRFVASIARVAARHDVEVETVRSEGTPAISSRGSLYGIMAEASRALDAQMVIVPSLCPGMTDVRHFRARGADGYGWVPVMLTNELLATVHGHDERIPLAGFTRGVEAMTDVVHAAAT